MKVRFTSARRPIIIGGLLWQLNPVAVSGPPPVNTGAPSVSGSAVVGSLLSANAGTWTGSPTFTYRWRANGVTIPAASASTYTVRDTDVGATISVEVTGVNSYGSAVAVSGGVGPVVAPIQLGTLLATRTATNFDTVTAPANSFYSTTQAFPQRAIPSGYRPEMRLSDGTTAITTQQCSARTFWSDGSLKLANFLWQHPNALAASASDTVKFYAVSGAYSDTTAITTSPLTTHDYKVQVVIGGTTYTFSVNTALAGSSKRVMRQGAAAVCYHVWGELLNGATPQGTAWVKLWAYVFADGSVRIQARLRASRMASSAAISVTSAALKDGSASLVSLGAFTLYAGTMIELVNGDGASWYSGTDTDKVVWAFPKPAAADATTTGLFDALIYPWLEWSSGQVSAINAISTPALSYAPNTYGEINSPNQPGASSWIGPMPSYSTQAMLSGNYFQFRRDRINALAGHICQIWVCDPVTSLPPPLNHKANGAYSGTDAAGTAYSMPNDAYTAYWYYGGGGTTISATDGQVPTAGVADTTHQPNHYLYQYLATGYEWWLDAMMEEPTGFLGYINPGTADWARNPDPSYMGGTQYYGCMFNAREARAFAWWARTTGSAAWVAPDTHPMKQYLADLLRTNYDALAAYIAHVGSPLSIWPATYGAQGSCATFMHDYAVIQIGMDVRRGAISLTHPIVTGYVKQFVFGRVISGSWYRGSGPYNMGIRQGANPLDGGALCTAWSQVYVGDRNSNQMTYALLDANAGKLLEPNGVDTVSGADPWGGGHHYPNLLLCAGASMAMAGMTEGQTVYDRWRAWEAGGTIGGDTYAAHPGTDAAWAAGPQWRIRVPA